MKRQIQNRFLKQWSWQLRWINGWLSTLFSAMTAVLAFGLAFECDVDPAQTCCGGSRQPAAGGQSRCPQAGTAFMGVVKLFSNHMRWRQLKI
jgi:hypothetical protein